jgi:hypothetical protein
MPRNAATLDGPFLVRTPGIVAVAGSLVGTALVVITLLVLLYTEAPWWMSGWTGACGAVFVASGLWAWRRPHDVFAALQVGATVAVAGVGSSAPAMRMWIQVGLAETGLQRVEVAVVGVTLGLLCACYLAFVMADLVRGAR